MTTTALDTPNPSIGVHARPRTTTRDRLAGGSVRHVWAVTRILLGWIFLWPFLDKLFGLGHETPSAKAWIHGGSPTTGFLKGAVGPFAGIYHSLSGSAWADWGFMIGLVCIGAALLAGVGVRVAAGTGALLLILMWSASLPPANNPFLDEHLVYAAVLVGLAMVGAGNTWGFGRRWSETDLVRRHPWLA